MSEKENRGVNATNIALSYYTQHFYLGVQGNANASLGHLWTVQEAFGSFS